MPREGQSIPLSYTYFMTTIWLLAYNAGVDGGFIAKHSLRRGGATFLRLCGASISEIKDRGDWSSDAVYAYIRTPLVNRLARDKRIAHIFNNY